MLIHEAPTRFQREPTGDGSNPESGAILTRTRVPCADPLHKVHEQLQSAVRASRRWRTSRRQSGRRRGPHVRERLDRPSVQITQWKSRRYASRSSR